MQPNRSFDATREQGRKSKPVLVVGIGASAGALDVLKSLFARIPSDAGIAFVVIQHLGREQPSLLAEILASVATMPVQEAQDGVLLQPNHIYVIQPNTQLRLDGDALRADAVVGEGLRLPVNAFLRSLAEERTDTAVAVILSGTGADGTEGLRTVKEHGGVAVAQAPETAKYEGMPKSAIDAGLIDFVLPVEEIPGKLVELARRRNEELQDNDRALTTDIADNVERICEVLRRHTGHDFGSYRKSTLTRRIRRRLFVRGSVSAADYLRVLEQDPNEPALLVNELLIGVTQFFRDPEAFLILETQVVPSLFEGKPVGVPVRVWVPGCASGEEAYSLAMLLAEHGSRIGQSRPIQIFASDIDGEKLAQARQGIYAQEIARQLSPERLQRFFQPHGEWLQVVKELRDMCVFSMHNLIRDPPFSSLDLISCRNLLIYLHLDLQQKVLPLFHYALRPGGYLFLGPSETLASASELFSTVDQEHRIFRSRDVGRRARPDLPLLGQGRAKVAPEISEGNAPSQPGHNQAFERLILTEYAPACAVVDERGEIFYSAGRTGRYLQARAGSPSRNILDMAEGIFGVELRAALLRACQTDRRVVRDGIPVETEEQDTTVKLTIRPLPRAAVDPRRYLVVLQEPARPEVVSPEIHLEGQAPLSTDALADPGRLATELKSARSDLQMVMQELAAANEELRSSNEELVLTNEELQSANEELRSSQEELQSINEELESVNSELREKVKEITTAHTELQNLYASSQIATVYINAEMRIARFTPATKALLHLIDADIGRPLADLAARLLGEHLVADAQGSLSTGASFERQVRTADGTWLLKRVLPYRALDDSIAGVSVTFIDVTAIKHAEEALRESEQRFRTMADSIPQLAWIANADGFIYWYNRRWYEYTGTTAEQMEGWGWQSVHDPETLPNVLEQWKASIASGSPFDMTFPLRGADGRFRPFLTRVVPLRDSEGHVVQWFGTNTDVYERVEIENQLRVRESELREADRHKNEFLAMLSHELRNPLAPISNSLYILDRVDPQGEQGQRARTVIDRQVVHLTRLIDDLLDVTRISRGKVELHRASLDLRDLIVRTTEDHQAIFRAAGVELETSLVADPVSVFGDRVRLAQALGNLLSNAAKFTPHGGHALVTLEVESGQAVVSVSDTGMGIDPAFIPRLFVPFVQADTTLDRGKGGLGLGLSLVKGLVDMHGGTVSVHSDGPSRGTTFVIRLPLYGEGEAQKEARGRGTGSRRVLVIEDNVDAADSLREVLELGSNTVDVAYTAQEGIAKAHAFKPEAVVCDIGLPEMDGYEVARRMRSDPELRDVTLIALTGYAQPDDVARSRAAGFDVHLAKPPSIEALDQAVRRSH